MARRTTLLVVLVLACGAGVLMAHGRLERARAAAFKAGHDIQACARQLDDLRRWRSGATAALEDADSSQLSRLVRQAADAAGAASALVSLEPSAPQPASGGMTQTAIFLRLESIPLRELTTFLHRLCESDPASRAQSVELSAAGAGGGSELWHADVTIAYLSHGASRR
jgi:hypothetical protein